MAASNHRQRGGTFLGIIFGLLLGLGAALAVAIYVTKEPIPFTNKGAAKPSTAELNRRSLAQARACAGSAGQGALRAA